MKEPILLLWSGGKDSTLALQTLQNSAEWEVRALLTTMTQGYDRISIHGVRRVLLEAQAEALGLPLEMIYIPQACTNADYERVLTDALARHRKDGVSHAAAGDIFLQDVKRYRENLFAVAGMQGIFPLWNADTDELARSFIASGFGAALTCVDTHALDSRFAGRAFGERLLRDLPATADPCGENGEFHSFVYDGPLFQSPVCHTKGEIILRDNRFCYCDLVPET